MVNEIRVERKTISQFKRFLAIEINSMTLKGTEYQTTLNIKISWIDN